MAMIRFISPPGKPDLELATVPAVFKDYICDIDEADPALSRMRYLGTPFGVIEVGVVSADYPWPTLESLSAEIADPTSVLGKQLRDLFATAASMTAVSDRVTALTSRVDGLGSDNFKVSTGVGDPATFDLSGLNEDDLVILFTSDPNSGG